MNTQLIKELAGQAAIRRDKYGMYHSTEYDLDGVDHGVNLEAFAELLIKEFLDKVEIWEKDSRNHISYLLKNHFGVE